MKYGPNFHARATILSALERAEPKPLYMSELAEITGIRKDYVSQTCTVLSRMGAVKRYRSRVGTRVELTQKAR